MFTTQKFIEESFIANGAEWQVSHDGEWIMLVCDLSEDEEFIGHVQPAGAWNKMIQECAEEHRAVMLGI